MIEAIYKAHDINQEIIRFIDGIVADCGKPKHSYASCAVRKSCLQRSKKLAAGRDGGGCIHGRQAGEEENIRQITEKLKEAFAENEEWLSVLGEAVYQYQKKQSAK